MELNKTRQDAWFVLEYHYIFDRQRFCWYLALFWQRSLRCCAGPTLFLWLQEIRHGAYCEGFYRVMEIYPWN